MTLLRQFDFYRDAEYIFDIGDDPFIDRHAERFCNVSSTGHYQYRWVIFACSSPAEKARAHQEAERFANLFPRLPSSRRTRPYNPVRKRSIQFAATGETHEI